MVDGAAQAEQSTEAFDNATKELVSTLFELQDRLGVLNRSWFDYRKATIDATGKEPISDFGDAFHTALSQIIASIKSTKEELLNLGVTNEKLHDNWEESVLREIGLYKELAGGITVTKEQLDALAKKIAATPLPSGNTSTETNQTTESVNKLTESMRLAAEVAKEYGISGSRASREIAMAARDAGVSFEEMARSILHGVYDPVTKATSLLYKMLQAEQAVADAGKQIELDIGTSFSSLPPTGTASETGFAEMMELMGDSTWEKWTEQLGKSSKATEDLKKSAEGATESVKNATEASEGYIESTNTAAEATESAAQAQKTGLEIQDEYFASLDQGNQVIAESVEHITILDEEIESLGHRWRQAFMSFRDIGKSPQEALEGLNDAVQEGIRPSAVLNHNLNERFRIEQSLAQSGKSWNEIQKEMRILAEKNAEAMGRVGTTGIQSSRAFFALTLASFGVMSVAQELKKSFGDDLPPALEKTSAAIQQIASFGSAGAFVGGAPGAIFGGIAGGLIAVTTAGVTLDPVLQNLNRQLDNMSNRDDLAATLSEIAGVSKTTAEIWLEAARKDTSFAQLLEDIVRKGEPVPGVLATINDFLVRIGVTSEGLGNTFGELGDKLNKVLLVAYAGAVGIGELFTIAKENITQGFPNVDPLKNQERIINAVKDAYNQVEKATKGAGIAQADASNLTAQANAILADQEDILKRLKDAQEDYADALLKAGSAQADLDRRMADQSAQAQQQYSNAIEDAAEARANAVFNAEQNLANRISDLWQDLENRIVDINTNLSNRISDIQLNLANRISDINAQLANRMEDIQTQLGESIHDIQLDLANKLRDLDRRRSDDLRQANKKEEEAARALARTLYEIERDRLQSIEALAFNTHEQLMDARTSHDRDRIIRRAQFEQSQIEQQANNARRDAQLDFDDKVRQAEEERRLAEETYQYEVRLAKMLAEQKIAEAQRAAQIQMQQAQQNAAMQIEQANRQAAQQIAIAEREAAQQLAVAQRRHQQELESAQRTYAQQVEAAQRAEAQRVADAQRALEQRMAAIAQTYAFEQQKILETLNLAIWAYNKIIESINLANASLFTFAQQYQNFIDDPLGLDFNNPNNSLIPTLPGLSAVPQTERNNSTISPVSVNTSSRNSSVNIVINDATDPQRVGMVVRRVLQDTLSGAA